MMSEFVLQPTGLTGSNIKCVPALSEVVSSHIMVSPNPQRGGLTFFRASLLLLTLLLLCLSFLVILLLFGPLSFLLETETGKILEHGFDGICDTEECVQVSYRVLSSGDFRSDPCQDFFHYTCSKWQAKNPVASEQLYHAANTNLLSDQVDLQIKDLLTKHSVNETGNEFKALKSFYQSCLNFTSPKEETVVTEILNSFGGYERAASWSDSSFDLTNLTLKLLHANGAPLFDLMLDIDAKNRSQYALIIELPRPTSMALNLLATRRFPEDISFFKDQRSIQSILQGPATVEIQNASGSFGSLNRQKLYKIITESLEGKKLAQLKLLVNRTCRALNMTESEITSDIGAISRISDNIRKLLPSPRTRKFLKQQNRVYNEYTIDRLQNEFQMINWKRLISGLMEIGKAVNSSKTRSFDWSQLKIYVPYPDYLRRLFATIQKEDRRSLHNMMLMVYVRDVLNDLSEKKNEEDKWKFCVQSTKSVFAMELSALYLRSFDKYYLQEVRRDIDEIFAHVRQSVIRFLRKSDWLGADTKQQSIAKIEALQGHFIGPSFYYQDGYLDIAANKVQMNASDFFFNIRQIYRIFREQLYQLYLTQVDEEKATWAFVAFPFTVNAFYIQQFNSIVIPLAFLNPPQYTARASSYVNYATIALTLAHETLHALDGSGSGFDAQGTLQDWWSDEAKLHLQEKSACVAKQYSQNFQKIIPFYEKTVPIQVDGNLTQNENIADIAGIQVAFDAFTYQRSDFGDTVKHLKIPGVDFTLDQTFFVTAAQAYCANIAPMGYVFLLEADEHTTHDFRINGMMMNFPKFSEAFNCSSGTRMNPRNKCSFW